MPVPVAPAWRATPFGATGRAVSVLLLALGLLAGRADVALLGVPLALGLLWGGRPGAPAAGHPRSPTAVRLDSAGETATAGQLAARLDVRPSPGAELVHVRVTAPGHRPVDVVVPAAPRRLPLRLSAVRTGTQRSFHADVRGYGPGGGTSEAPVSTPAPELLVLPSAMRLGSVPLPHRLRGLTGPHTSRRLGDGSELRDVHPFAPGDQVRRIDWRTTARRSPDLEELYVRRTYATSEATVVLVLDSRDDVGPDLSTWRGSGPRRVDEPTSLDLARNAAASVAGALVEAGDRVGLEDLGRRRRPLPPAAGRRHLRRLLHGLALCHPVGTPGRRLRPPQVPADAFVYLFTTVLDDEPSTLVRYWRETGHGVVVVDTLPDVRPAQGEHMRIAWRITSMEREDRIAHLRAEGVPVVRWAGSARDGAPAQLEALAAAARRHRAPVVGR